MNDRIPTTPGPQEIVNDKLAEAIAAVDEMWKSGDDFQVIFKGPVIEKYGMDARSLTATIDGTAGLVEALCMAQGLRRAKVYVRQVDIEGDEIRITYRAEVMP